MFMHILNRYSTLRGKQSDDSGSGASGNDCNLSCHITLDKLLILYNEISSSAK